jgi:hypothetical protein
MSSYGRPIPPIYPPSLERGVDGQGRSPPSGGEEEQTGGRIKQEGDDQDEPAQHILIASAEQCRQIADRAQVRISHLPLAFDTGLLDLKIGEHLALPYPLGHEVGPVALLIAASCMAALVRPLAVDFSTAPSIWPMRRSRSATIPACMDMRASISAARPATATSPSTWWPMCALARKP